jgi:hypothetical protein
MTPPLSVWVTDSTADYGILPHSAEKQGIGQAKGHYSGF